MWISVWVIVLIQQKAVSVSFSASVSVDGSVPLIQIKFEIRPKRGRQFETSVRMNIALDRGRRAGRELPVAPFI